MDGSTVHVFPGASGSVRALVLASADDAPVAARKWSAVLEERPGASSALCSAPAVGPAAASAMVEASPATAIPSTIRSGSVTGTAATVASTRSTTGCSTGSRTGTASASGGATVSTRSSAAISTTPATGTATEVTVPAGTTLFTTGNGAIRWSAVPATLPTTGCSSPLGEGAGDAASRMGEAAPDNGAVRDETDDATPPRTDPESLEESAVAAEAESVSQVAVTAPARRSGRSARQGERNLAMRTTPSIVETYDFISVRLSRAGSLGKLKINPSSLLICHSVIDNRKMTVNPVYKNVIGQNDQWASFG